VVPSHEEPLTALYAIVIEAAGGYSFILIKNPSHTTIGCGEQGFPSAQPYLSLL
jgi:hypothetical protein